MGDLKTPKGHFKINWPLKHNCFPRAIRFQTFVLSKHIYQWTTVRYARHHNPLLIRNSWILVIHKDIIFGKNLLWKQRNAFQKWDKKHKSRSLYWCAYCIQKLQRDCLRFLFLFLKSNWLLILWYSCDFCKLALAYFFVYFEALAFAFKSCKSMYD